VKIKPKEKVKEYKERYEEMKVFYVTRRSQR
jgi:hypothetical protein